MGLQLKIAGKTDKGKRRDKNEDSFLIDTDLGFIIVADGMGGHASGEVASHLATNVCSNQLKRSLQTGHVPIFYHVPAPSPQIDPRSLILGDCVKFANQAVYEAAQATPANHNMGTTLVAALWLDDKLAIAHVGDSRLYTVHQGQLTQRTVDHSFIQEQIDRGLLSKEEAEKSDFKNMLTRSVGVSEDVKVDIQELTLNEKDFVLVCSDGLTKMISDKDIESVFKEKDEPDDIATTLIQRANDAGGGDNITAVVAKLEGSTKSFTERIKALLSGKRKGR